MHVWYALCALVAFVAIDHLGDLLHQLDLRRFMPWRIVLAIRNSLEVAFSILGVAVAHRGGLKFAVGELDMTAPVKPALAFAAIASAPMFLAFAFGFSINHGKTFLSVAVGCFIAPFAEEVLFRGYLFRQLYQRAHPRTHSVVARSQSYWVTLDISPHCRVVVSEVVVVCSAPTHSVLRLTSGRLLLALLALQQSAIRKLPASKSP